MNAPDRPDNHDDTTPESALDDVGDADAPGANAPRQPEMPDDTHIEPAASPEDARRTDPLAARLLEERKELLDLTARNRLLNTPRRYKRSSSIEIVDERANDVIRHLVSKGRVMTFLPHEDTPNEHIDSHIEHQPSAVTPRDDAHHHGEDDDIGDADRTTDNDALEQPDEQAQPTLDSRQTDARLQTTLSSRELQKRLLKTYYQARTFEEERGINVLYLAVGFLRWLERDNAARTRHAPLLLIPVEIDRPGANRPFRIKFSGEDITTNLSLQIMLRNEFGIDLPDVESTEDLNPDAYFASVEETIARMDGWEVFRNDMVLWFFSFAKLLMYRDLDPAQWPDNRLVKHALIRRLLGSRDADLPKEAGDDAHGTDEGDDRGTVISSHEHERDLNRAIHIMNADHSQTEAIEAVRRGVNLVIQGPPGTGKSQTISNIIGAAVADGKKVLFVSEKLAALEVVKNRLEHVGLGDMCLELHSDKARKRAVLEELERTLKLGAPKVEDFAQLASDLARAQSALDQHVARMHTPDPVCGLTPYHVISQLIRLRETGIPPSSFRINDAQRWNADTLRLHERNVHALAEQVRAIGVPEDHPFCGVMLESILPMDVERLGAQAPEVRRAIDELLDKTTSLAQSLSLDVSTRTTTSPDADAPTTAHSTTSDDKNHNLNPHVTLKRAAQLAHTARAYADAPHVDAHAVADPVWTRNRQEITRLLDAGRTCTNARQTLEHVVTDAAWTDELVPIRRDLAAFGRSRLRFLNRAYRHAKARLRGIMREAPPRSLDEQLAVLDTLIAAQHARQTIEQLNDIGTRAFGEIFLARSSDFGQLEAIATWVDSLIDNDALIENARGHFAAVSVDPDTLRERAAHVEHAQTVAQSRLDAIIRKTKLDLAQAFSDPDGNTDIGVADVSLARISDRLARWSESPEAISAWIRYRHERDALRDARAGELANRMHDGRIDPDEAVDLFHAAVYESILRRMAQDDPEIARFDGASHERFVEEFRQLDDRRIHLARQQVALAHHRGIPRGPGEIGEMGVIQREIGKRRRHMPIRQLLRQAGNAVLAIKPVMMMSPLSIAQYVEPGALEFDLLLIDEASQVRPVDALGAVARARQIVVVGDDKQLPPTTFFDKLLDDDIDDNETTFIDQRAGDLESILNLCRAGGLRQRMLRWHYRSRHHSLITVSNQAFYDNSLHVIPSPYERNESLGVRFHFVEDGVFDRGGTGANRIEAQRVAEAVMQHARLHPSTTLGVGAFSVSQRDAILDELERLRRQDTSLEPFFSSDSEEPFFVKNLENVQGDERDVIYISIGYGRDASGRIHMNFGPLSNEGGERRLNVLITRARVRCEVFSSITADDIDLSRVSRRGPEALKRYLAYAHHGAIGIASGDAEPDDDDAFRMTLERTMKAHGYDVASRVGVAGFFVGLAVRDPSNEGRFMLGVEWDGPAYANAESTHDRNRTRPDVLNNLGWSLHRVWTTDWFNLPEKEQQKLLDVLEAHRSQSQEVRNGDAADQLSRSGDTTTAAVEREAAPDETSDARRAELVDLSEPYEEAAFRVPGRQEIHELTPEKLSQIVHRIVRIESPIHRDEIVTRVRMLWGLARAGSRIQDAVAEAIETAAQKGLIKVSSAFCVDPAGEVVVRNRADVESSSLRDLAMIPPAEMQQAIVTLVRHHLGASRDEVIVATARMLGFKSTSNQLRELLSEQIEAMLADNRLVERDGRLHQREGDDTNNLETSDHNPTTTTLQDVESTSDTTDSN